MKLPKCFKHRNHILLPIGFIKIDGQKKTSLVEQHGVDPHNKNPPNFVFSGKVPAHYLVGDRKKSLIQAIGAFDCGLSAYPMNPLVATGGLVSAFSALAAHKSIRVNVIATAKQ